MEKQNPTVPTTWYVTEFWETEGIREVQGYIWPTTTILVVPVIDNDGGWVRDTHYYEPHYYRTKESARDAIRGFANTKAKTLDLDLANVRKWL